MVNLWDGLETKAVLPTLLLNNTCVKIVLVWPQFLALKGMDTLRYICGNGQSAENKDPSKTYDPSVPCQGTG